MVKVKVGDLRQNHSPTFSPSTNSISPQGPVSQAAYRPPASLMHETFATTPGLRQKQQLQEQQKQIKEALQTGFSGEPKIPRDMFTQKLASFYYEVFEQRRHVLVIYDRAPRLLSVKRLVTPLGEVVEGPTERCTVHKKCKGVGGFMRWGYDIWVFEEGVVELLGDGGFLNWCLQSPDYIRDGNKVVFGKLKREEGETAATISVSGVQKTPAAFSVEEEEIVFENIGMEEDRNE